MARRRSASNDRDACHGAAAFLVFSLLAVPSVRAQADEPPAAFTVEFAQPFDDPRPEQPEVDPLAELEQLLRQPVITPGPPPATLLAIEAGPGGDEYGDLGAAGVPRITPAAVMRIDDDMIWSSGARSLNELFDIYVPNVQVIRHHFAFSHLGIRGIISDREDKYLLRVNDRIMNNRTELGAYSEHNLPMLGDIHHIDFVSGPGSATYGPGAIAGVANIVTHNGLTFQGADATVRQGFLEEFTTAEVRFGRQFCADEGIFVYYGFSAYDGADQAYSPYVFGRSFTSGTGVPVVAGEPVTFAIPDDHRTYQSMGRHKVHAQYTNGPLDVWVRYTRSGEQEVPTRGDVASANFANLRTFETGYQQLTAFGSYNWEINDELNVQFVLSWDSFDFVRLDRNPASRLNFREEETYARILARWQPVENHAFGVGVDYSHEIFGLDDSLSGLPAITQRLRATTAPWETDTFSVFGEYQWKINDDWTAFLSARGDNHTYSQWLFSPRAAMVYTPTDCDTIKFIASQAVRRQGDDELRAEFLTQGTLGDSEVLQGLELRYERQQTDDLWMAVSAFYEDHAAVGFSGTAGRSLLLGEFEIWGIEPALIYRTDRQRLIFSHGYTKLGHAQLADPTLIQGISAEPYGFGSDLANWANNLTKVYASHAFCDCWSVDGSLRVYWDFPGARDLTAFNNAQATPSGSIGFSDPGYEKAFRSNVYLNFGLQHKPWDDCIVRLDFYNVLGWIDQDLNKRNYINRVSEYRSEAASVALTVRVDY